MIAQTPASYEQLAELELSELLDSLAPDFDEGRRAAIRATVARKYRRLRELRAELELLTAYDRRRSLAGWDYGSGQRHRELSRVRWAVERLEDELEISPLRSIASAHPTRAEKADAYRRIMQPKAERILRREDYRRGTKPTEKTLEILLSLARGLGVYITAGR